jgi:hypothetical protein
MDARDLVLLRYDAIHGTFVDQLFQDISDREAREQPHGVNSIAWLVWHMTRVEDAAVSRFVAGRPQVVDEGDWCARMGVARRDVGPGMTRSEVAALSAAMDVPALRAYQRAVTDRTRAVVASLPPSAWEEVVPAEHVRSEVTAEGLLVEAGAWVGDFWARGWSRGWYLLQTGLLHPYGHCFEGLVTRGLLGRG